MEFLYGIGSVLYAIGEKIVEFIIGIVTFLDNAYHREEYDRIRRRKIAFWVVVSVIGTIVIALFFPYRLVVKKNGNFEIRCLLLRVSRNKPDGSDLPATQSRQTK